MFLCNFIKPLIRRNRAGRIAGLRVAALVIPVLLLWNLGAALELNSERIERVFGSYGLRVLEQQQRLRVTSLFSDGIAGPVCRTLATVRFPTDIPIALAEPHEAIVQGASIGATLKDSGWEIRKVNRHLGTINVPGDAARISALMKIGLPDSLAMHVYDLDVRRGDEHYRYATIIEVHHPDYLSAGGLQTLYDDLPVVPLEAAELEEFRLLAAAKMQAPEPR